MYAPRLPERLSEREVEDRLDSLSLFYARSYVEANQDAVTQVSDRQVPISENGLQVTISTIHQIRSSLSHLALIADARMALGDGSDSKLPKNVRWVDVVKPELVFAHRQAGARLPIMFTRTQNPDSQFNSTVKRAYFRMIGSRAFDGLILFGEQSYPELVANGQVRLQEDEHFRNPSDTLYPFFYGPQ